MSSASMFGATGLDPNNQAQIDAVKTILGLGAGTFALGAGARGLAGLGNFVGRNLGGGGAKTPLRQSFVRIPVPVKVRTPEERDAVLAAAESEYGKEAGLVKLAEEAQDLMSTLSKGLAGVTGLTRSPGEMVSGLRDTVSGWNSPSIWQKPWAYPAAGLAAAGGLYGGWKLTDYLLDKTKSMEQESELEAARKEYESALAGRRKVAAAGAPPDPLETWADLYEKRGFWVNEGIGLGLLGAGTIAGLSGLGTYNWTRSLAEDKAVEEAVKKRQAQIAEQAPSPIMAIPTPMPVMARPRRSHLHRMLGLGHEPKKHEKAGNIGQAADQFLGRIRSNQMAVWQRLMTPADAKPAKPPAQSDKPLPPQLPTLAGTRSQMMGQLPVAGTR